MQLPVKITRTYGRTVLQAKRNSPHIFFGAGVLGAAISTVLACRATLKLEKTLDEIKDQADKVKVSETIVESERSRELTKVYAKGTLQIGLLYLPSTVLGTASIAALTGSHIQLARRNSALTATVATISQAYANYRERVKEAVGEEKELDIYRGAVEETREIDGKKQKVKTYDPTGTSVYARCFDSTSWQWKNNAELNRMFLQHQQSYLNHQLQARGYVLLNDVYEALGLAHTSAGTVVGWVATGDGDGYIDFHIFEPSNSEFVNGQEPCVWLDFNVDGMIYQLIDEVGR